ncbi:MAG: disulfide bond formation protein B [Hydrogenophilaceae bacterium]|jgi:disulfide bond formation protein DsbB|nr:disulfide bond formation protein B [Hydrogenophilaceae bacterium]
MSALASRMLPFWALVALAACAAILSAAHLFERVGDLAPCALCYKQRQVYWGAGAFALVGFAGTLVFRQIAVKRAVAALLGVAFLIGAIVAMYHVAVEQKWIVAQCDLFGPREIPAFDAQATFDIPACDEVQWAFLGVSMAGWNGLISAALAAASFLVAAAPRPVIEGDA